MVFGPRSALAVLAACLWTAAGGCASVQSHRALYETIEAEARVDTDQARKENDKGLKYLECCEPEKAEEAFQQALVADVSFGPAHNNLGQLYFQQGKYYLAAWEFEYATRLMPRRPESFNNLGLVLETVGRFDDAVQQYEIAHALDPDDPEFLGNLARARIRRGDRTIETAQLLREIEFRDGRPEWRMWAREQLHTKHLDMWDTTSVVIPASGAESSISPDDTISESGPLLRELSPPAKEATPRNSKKAAPPAPQIPLLEKPFDPFQ